MSEILHVQRNLYLLECLSMQYLYITSFDVGREEGRVKGGKGRKKFWNFQEKQFPLFINFSSYIFFFFFFFYFSGLKKSLSVLKFRFVKNFET